MPVRSALVPACVFGFALAAAGTVGCGHSSSSTDAAIVIPPDAISISIVEAYAKAWGEPDAAARGRLLAYSAVDTLTVYEPTRTLASRTEVDAAMAAFTSANPGGTIPIVGNVRELNDRVWIRWDALQGNGTKLETGVDVMQRAADQRIETVHSFFGTLPLAVGANSPVQQALLDAWNQPNASMRTALLMTAVTDDVRVMIEGQPTVSSRTTFSSIIGVALDAAPGRTMTVTSGYLALPNAFHVAWRTLAMDGTTVLGEG